mmetsp:Transcript_19779/g.58687  ORF Transcript_19779/g.58687 Transcript_19779/m.58687 type:complete len:283 (-) Transcript_19779:310-1158(-)
MAVATGSGNTACAQARRCAAGSDMRDRRWCSGMHGSTRAWVPATSRPFDQDSWNLPPPGAARPYALAALRLAWSCSSRELPSAKAGGSAAMAPSAASARISPSDLWPAAAGAPADAFLAVMMRKLKLGMPRRLLVSVTVRLNSDLEAALSPSVKTTSRLSTLARTACGSCAASEPGASARAFIECSASSTISRNRSSCEAPLPPPPPSSCGILPGSSRSRWMCRLFCRIVPTSRSVHTWLYLSPKKASVTWSLGNRTSRSIISTCSSTTSMRVWPSAPRCCM